MKPRRRTVPATLYAQLIDPVTLVTDSDGSIVASLQDNSVALGKVSAGTGKRARDLREGFPLSALTSAAGSVGHEMRLLLRRLAGHGLLKYRLGRSRAGGDAIVIEPQVPDYWPGTARLLDADVLVLSRFAYMRRRGTDLVLESPRAAACGAPALARQEDQSAQGRDARCAIDRVHGKPPARTPFDT